MAGLVMAHLVFVMAASPLLPQERWDVDVDAAGRAREGVWQRATHVMKTDDQVLVPVEPNGSYSLMVGGETWLPAGATFVRHSGKTWSTHDGSLVLSRCKNSRATDRGGIFNETTLNWNAGGRKFETSVKVYARKVVFRQTFIDRLDGTDASPRHKDGVASGWPAFRMLEIPGTPRGVISFKGQMSGMDTATGPFGKQNGVVGEGVDGSGPVVIFTKSMNRTIVVSAYKNFMAASQGIQDSPPHSSGDSVLSYGVLGSVAEIPAGFVIETVVTFSAAGVNDAMVAWGDTLLHQSGKRRTAYRDDFVMQQLGYSTDNGGFYCCCTPYAPPQQQCVNPPPANESYEDTLLGVHKYAGLEELPYQYILLDSWWYYKGLDGNVDVWDMRPSVFPHGLGTFAEKTGWKYQLHCGQKWTAQTAYSKTNGGKYNFIENGSMLVVPDDQLFWDDLIANKTAANMITYEMDWMNDQFGSAIMLANATLGRTWLMQVDTAARKANVTVQMCMTLVRQVLQSVEMMSVTNARASNDYHPGDDQWSCIGTTSILLHALGVGPSKDSFWSTTEVQSGSHWGDNVREPHSELQAVVASLTAGPVATSDKIGHANRSLILRSCDASGRLLTPDAPARELDAHFAHLAFGSESSHLPRWSALRASRVLLAKSKRSTCSLEQNVDYQGNDLGPAHHNISSAGACCELCETTPDCLFFSWLNTLGYRGYCSLKTSNMHKVHANGHISGSTTDPAPPAPPSQSNTVGVDGHLQATSVTAADGLIISYVLAVKVLRNYNLSMAELGYSNSTKLVAFETHAPAHPHLIGPNGLSILECGEDDFQLYTVAPVLSSGWVLLGEPNKWVSVSRQRFSNLTSTSTGARVVVAGAVDENVTVNWMDPEATLVSIHCTISSSGMAIVAVGRGELATCSSVKQSI